MSNVTKVDYFYPVTEGNPVSTLKKDLKRKKDSKLLKKERVKVIRLSTFILDHVAKWRETHPKSNSSVVMKLDIEGGLKNPKQTVVLLILHLLKIDL